jgi:hypothetical protein
MKFHISYAPIASLRKLGMGAATQIAQFRFYIVGIELLVLKEVSLSVGQLIFLTDV